MALEHNDIDTYLLIRFFRCSVTPEEEARIRTWLADDPDGSHAEQYRTAHLMYSGMLVHSDAGSRNAGRRRYSSAFRRLALTLAASAAALLLVSISSYVTNRLTLDALSSEMESIKVPAGTSVELTLSDGSTVWLNACTELEYPSAFAKGDRTVRLISGEAMFDVQHDDNRPFNVETFASVITVMGTRFNVLADSENGEFSTALIRGSVKVRSLIPSDDSEFLLNPNEMIRMDGDGFRTTRFEDSSRIECWTKGLVDVAGAPFDRLMQKFERLYDVDIIIDRPELPVVRYTWGKIRVSDGLDHALSVLAKASDFTWERNNDTGAVIIR